MRWKRCQPTLSLDTRSISCTYSPAQPACWRMGMCGQSGPSRVSKHTRGPATFSRAADHRPKSKPSGTRTAHLQNSEPNNGGYFSSEVLGWDPIQQGKKPPHTATCTNTDKPHMCTAEPMTPDPKQHMPRNSTSTKCRNRPGGARLILSQE